MSFAAYLKFVQAEKVNSQKRVKAKIMKLVKVMVELSLIDSPGYSVCMDLHGGQYPQLRIYDRRDHSELIKADYFIPYHIIRGSDLDEIQKEEKEAMEYLDKMEKDLRKYAKLMKDGQ